MKGSSWFEWSQLQAASLTTVILLQWGDGGEEGGGEEAEGTYHSQHNSVIRVGKSRGCEDIWLSVSNRRRI